MKYLLTLPFVSIWIAIYWSSITTFWLILVLWHINPKRANKALGNLIYIRNSWEAQNVWTETWRETRDLLRKVIKLDT